jgi:hypothetical protein
MTQALKGVDRSALGANGKEVIALLEKGAAEPGPPIGDLRIAQVDLCRFQSHLVPAGTACV